LTTSAQVSKVQVRGWDIKKKVAVTGEATRGAHVPQIGLTTRGGTLAEQAHSVRAEFLVNEPLVRTQGAAEKLAKAVADRLEGRFVEAEGSASGNPALLAGSTVKIEGVGTRFSGEYFVTSVNHSFTPSGGHTMQFTVSGYNPTNLVSLLSSDREFRAPSTVAVAIVTDNNDPESMGRVKLKYPWLSDKEGSHWARVASIGAGKERGIMYLPEVNDEVLVAFEHGDVRFPYVLGALWNGKEAPPAKNDDGKNNLRVIKSRSGHTIRLNDEDGKEMIEIIDGSEKNSIVIDMAKDAITITSEKDITLSAPKGAIKLDAGKIEIKSSASAKIEAGATMDVKAGATMAIKGATVNIN
jgi:uncharacterized protein involved in type VI secretion and phage assembly